MSASSPAHASQISALTWFALAVVRALNDAGRPVFMIINQSGIARGLYIEADMHAPHAFMKDELARFVAHIDDIRYCPYHPEATVAAYRRDSDWRKPGPSTVLDLIAHWPVDRAASVFIGDKEIDSQVAASIRWLKFSGGNLETFVRENVPGN